MLQSQQDRQQQLEQIAQERFQCSYAELMPAEKLSIIESLVTEISTRLGNLPS